MAGLLERHLQIALLWLVATVASVASQALPSCPDKCGNLTNISYPFGIKEGCYLNKSFLITCNESSGEAFLGTSNITVTNLSVVEGQLEISQFVARDCYEDGLGVERNRPWLWVPKSVDVTFAISSAKNKFTAVGCDTYATVTGKRGNQIYITGCMSYCSTGLPTENLVNNGSCSGIGCCQVSIPSGLTDIDVFITSYRNHSNLEVLDSCSYAFVAEESTFNFSFRSFDDLNKTENLPLVLDWTMGTENCSISKDKPDYGCKQKYSICVDVLEDGNGYRCMCLDGYKGNPYLPEILNGCQDVNECEDGSHNCIDEKHCINTVGSFNCSCPKGYHGDGTKEGTRCRAQVIKFSIGIGVSVLVLLVGILWLFVIYNKRKLLKLERKFFEQNGGKMLQKELNERQLSSETALIFSAEQLKEATNNYDESQIIGKGGFGTVYKGTLKSGREVAIKKPKSFDQSQVKTFIYEFIFLSQISHENIVKLLGCCLEKEVPLLVYEFVPNGTLSAHIHSKNRASALSWGVRLRVAAETAKALASLHSAIPPIIHRDVKPENILLDNNLKAKVSDFGASRLVPVDQTQLPTVVQGTFGYLDPEYFYTGQFTEKSDVFSFGVILVELLTSKRAVAMDKPENERSLVNLFLTTLKDDNHHHSLFQILDDQVAKDGSIEQIKEVAELAKRCLRVNGEERPTMEEVAMELEGLRVMGKHPWVGIAVNSEERRQLLGSSSIGSSYLGDNTSITTHGNSIGAFDISDGR